MTAVLKEPLVVADVYSDPPVWTMTLPAGTEVVSQEGTEVVFLEPETGKRLRGRKTT